MQKWLKSNEWRRNWVQRTYKIEIQKGWPINSDILQNGFLPESRSPHFNLYKFYDFYKTAPESCRIDWNAMNHEEFGSRKLLKYKYRSEEQIIQNFCKLGSLQKLGPSCLICRNFRTLRKMLMIHAEWSEI